jgi:hypothetical protein
MQNTGSAARLQYIHNFRGLAIMFIVATHCVSIFDWSQTPVLHDVLARVVANGSIFFLFIAGYLFDHLSASYRYQSYWATKMKFVVFPYLIVSIPAIIFFTFLAHREGLATGFYSQPKWKQIFDFLITGKHLAPFWFIPTIVIFYVVSPVLRRFFSLKIAYLTLPVLFFVGVQVPRGNALESFVHFLPIWVLGMACSRFRDQINIWFGRLLWPMIFVFLGLSAAGIHWAPGTHSWYSDLQKAVLTLIILECLRRIGHRGDRWFGLAGSLSFGIFFIHSYVITAAKIFIQWVSTEKLIGSLPLLLLAAFIAVVVTTLLVVLVKKVTGKRSRYLIGV